MILVFDTSILIDISRKNSKTLQKIKELSQKHPEAPQITIFTRFEFLYGAIEKDQTRIYDFLRLFNTINTTDKSAEIFAVLRKKYKTKGKDMPLIDLLIAGLVIENNFTLVTKDRDFEKIEELRKIIIS